MRGTCGSSTTPSCTLAGSDEHHACRIRQFSARRLHPALCKSTAGRATYLVHVPPLYDGAKPVPLVLAFHGGATDAEFMARFCGLNGKADQTGFIVVYPNGTGEFPHLLTWNAGSCCGFARRHQVDDVGFTLRDPGRHGKRRRGGWQAGLRHGHFQRRHDGYRLAAELAERIAAVAPVAGTLCLDAPRPAGRFL